MDHPGCDTRRIPDDHISQRRYPWFVALYVMYRAIEQLIQETQGGPSTWWYLCTNRHAPPPPFAKSWRSSKPVREPARQYGISEATVRKWRSRSSTEDRSHTPHRLQTHLTPAREAIVVYLRKQLLLPLDDLLAVVREFLCDKVSRSGLDRCLRRHGVSNLNDLKPKTPKPAQKAFKQLGCFHIDVKYLQQMADDSRRRYLFVAIDRATRWVFVQIHPNKTAATARRFLDSLQKATPIKITHIPTDNGQGVHRSPVPVERP